MNLTDNEILAKLSAPAKRALAGAGITTLAQLATYSEKQLLALHGLGPSSIPKIKQALAAAGLNLAK